MKIIYRIKFGDQKEVQKSCSGFSTLLVVIILGGVSLALTLALTTSSVYSIKGSIDSKSSITMKSLADGCAEVALEVMRENNAYTGTNTATIGSNTCTYTVTNTGGTTRAISVSGTSSGVTRKLYITTSTFNPLVISTWSEVQ